MISVLPVQMPTVSLHTQVTQVFVFVTELTHMLVSCTSKLVEIHVSTSALTFLLKPSEIMSHVTASPSAQTTHMPIPTSIVVGLTALKHPL